ncbi:terpene cyclase/mutase family protein [Aspergillus saccharolyticus JOP 1030-1]|uniref:Terpene cyclase/mutase family member n=1 Tax=Aspergillus saccharolyticus JOP 1030-1 TaxID=1450539 RepID=A0A318Z6N7_9EURO|nr:squalene-hopene cyclase [Aspergillus saccharolyticus JOP 1030-1]PYH42955.1 squalene-hopene cyclase [Aspergillus saccharolyticus JOP 1030-1]
MSTNIVTTKPGLANSASEPTVRAARAALDKATQYSFEHMKDDNHWCGELKSNATITAEYVFLRQALGLDLTSQAQPLIRWLLSQQNPDGSWGIAPHYPGDVSTSTEAYFALKMLRLPPESSAMRRAAEYIRSVGGIAQVRIFTRFYLAMFGLFPWAAVPELPAELIFMPAWAPINIYRFASWARSTIVPLLIVSHHRPIYPLPKDIVANGTYLDELWLDPADKMVPYQRPASTTGTSYLAMVFLVIDRVLHFLNGFRFFPTRGYSRRSCVRWILDHQEDSGDWAGIFPPMHLGLLALTLEGYAITDLPVVKALEAVERFAWDDHRGRRMQACVSPTWDTILMSIALCDAAHPRDSKRLQSAINWIQNHQLTQNYGDWQVYSPKTIPGGFSFEYFNTWYPDSDDTAAAIIAFLKHGSSATDNNIVRAVRWILGMQNQDGGWGAFDIDNDALFLNQIPFSDMDSLCDPSSADVTGRVLEAFGLLLQSPVAQRVGPKLLAQMSAASDRAILYLADEQEPNGAWYGRWGCNYIYGTSNVLCGLVYFRKHDSRVSNMASRAVQWVLSVQNADGGWGESLETYRSSNWTSIDHPSTASQTGWAVMALLPYLASGGTAIERGVSYLLQTQSKGDSGRGATWEETRFTATGFPRFFYIGYAFYAHYFPMMALGRYVQLAGGGSLGIASEKEIC